MLDLGKERPGRACSVVMLTAKASPQRYGKVPTLCSLHERVAVLFCTLPRSLFVFREGRGWKHYCRARHVVGLLYGRWSSITVLALYICSINRYTPPAFSSTSPFPPYQRRELSTHTRAMPPAKQSKGASHHFHSHLSIYTYTTTLSINNTPSSPTKSKQQPPSPLQPPQQSPPPTLP